MLNKKIFLTLVVFVLLSCIHINAQILFKMGNYRNLAYSSYGYSGDFANATFGIARRDSVKLIKRVVIGFLDVSLPLTQNFFTKRSIRKAFQVDIYKKKEFLIPYIFASSSILRENNFYKFHDVTAEFSFVPGVYRKKYTLALDLRYEMIAFRFIQYRAIYLTQENASAKNHWESPLSGIAKVGFVAGLNLNHLVIYIKSGYERNPFASFTFENFLPGYALLGFGYKFGTKPFKGTTKQV